MRFIKNIISSSPILSRLFVFFVFPLLIALFVFITYAKNSLPNTKGEIYVKGLNENVSIEENQFSFPLIRAKSDLDAFFGLGYVHAQNRLWQMEVGRRIASGRISEVIGASGLQSDKYMRTLGLRGDAIRMWEKLKPDTQAAIQSYTAGVNASIAGYKVLPLEFIYYRLEMEPWSVYDTLSIFESMAWMMSGNYREELKRASLIDVFGMVKARTLFPEISGMGADYLKTSSLGPSSYKNLASFALDFSLVGGSFRGSNNWVVSGKYTKSGRPLIANDPHLQMGAPSVWYMASMEGKKLSISGATLPGFPFVLVGHNKSIGWGVTNMGADVQDIRMERVSQLDTRKYLKDGEFKDFIVRNELISVRADFLKKPIEPVPLVVRETVNGVVLSDLSSEAPIFSLSWIGKFGLEGSIESFKNLGYAKDWNGFREALHTYVAPAQNFVFADIGGNIGYIAPGAIPIRKSGSGAMPSPGWSSDYDWSGWIPFDELPQSYNPESGVIATANNKVIEKEYKYYISADWAPSFRVDRIKQLISEQLAAGKKLTGDDFRLMQGDTISLAAKSIVPYLLQVNPEEPKLQQALKEIGAWNFDVSSDSIAASIYEAWIKNLNRLIFEDEFDPRTINSKNKIVLDDFINNPNSLLLKSILADDINSWCDYKSTPKIESCKDIIYLSLKASIGELERIAGSDMSSWQWSHIHNVHYSHFPFSKSEFSPFFPPVKNDFLHMLIHKRVGSAGDENTINVGSVDGERSNKRFQQFWGASFREVLDFGDLENSMFMIAPGQSGNVLSQHYSDLILLHSQTSMIEFSPIGNSSTTLLLMPTGIQ